MTWLVEIYVIDIYMFYAKEGGMSFTWNGIYMRIQYRFVIYWSNLYIYQPLVTD